MRYGEPSIARAIDELLAEGCRRLVLLPAFPQYASATTGSAVEETFRVLSRLRAIPALSVVPPYPVEPGYVDALAERARQATDGRAIDHWVLSFHGLPVRATLAGDPYATQCEATARALARRLDLREGSWTLAWQSRFGREPWLEPATDRVLADLGPRARTVAVLVPGFSADCLETIEELGIRGAETFRAAGGGELVLVPALNDDPGFVRTLRTLVERAAGAPLP
jgi:ferrochelatase